ncbi:sensor histidine kinase [Enterococcus sp. 669A]|uniref:Sensor histidine kinase n=1 Tax=Candidatus Enterococcus moelleringii TaxID=2815325 RepID=A0ABS3LBI1_9ENTE|nr:GHKL domain-containing protein [Enterococcus sp. 669A]MBO1307000.1 sensor histidine kinase [Enterococcus sp. 669A]
MQQAFYGALGSVMADVPWFILCCVPLMPLRKIEKKTMALRISLLCAFWFTCLFLGLWQNPQGGMPLLGVIRTGMYFPMLWVFYISFNVRIWKILYIFLFEQAAASQVNFASFFICELVWERSSSLLDGLWLPLCVWGILVIVYPLMWVFFKRVICPAMQILSEKQVRTLIVVPFLFFISTTVYGNISHMLNMIMWQRLIFSILFALIGIGAYVVTLTTTLDIVKKGKLEMEMLTMEQQLEQQSQRFNQLQSSIEQTANARHDLRHHFAVIRDYTKEADLAGLQAYLDEYLSYQPKEEAPVCENFAVDVLVRNYLHQARDAGAELDIKIGLPRKIAVPDSQLCIIFGNLFENAVQACQRQTEGKKFIRVRCVTEEYQFILTVDNSMDTQTKFQPGIGLSSVQAVVDKYNGALVTEVKDGIFQASVMLFMPVPESELAEA